MRILIDTLTCSPPAEGGGGGGCGPGCLYGYIEIIAIIAIIAIIIPIACIAIIAISATIPIIHIRINPTAPAPIAMWRVFNY